MFLLIDKLETTLGETNLIHYFIVNYNTISFIQQLYHSIIIRLRASPFLTLISGIIESSHKSVSAQMELILSIRECWKFNIFIFTLFQHI